MSPSIWANRTDGIHASRSPVFESADIPPRRMGFVLRTDSFGQCRSARQEAHIWWDEVRLVPYICFTLQRLQLMAEARYGEYKTRGCRSACTAITYEAQTCQCSSYFLRNNCARTLFTTRYRYGKSKARSVALDSNLIFGGETSPLCCIEL